MVNRTRLADLEDILDLLSEKLGEFKRELIINANTPAKFELKQRIKREILSDIRRYEAGYWELYPQDAIFISDEEAVRQLLKVEQAVESIERILLTFYPQKLIPLLRNIRAELEEQNKAASAKLKVVLPLITCYSFLRTGDGDRRIDVQNLEGNQRNGEEVGNVVGKARTSSEELGRKTCYEYELSITSSAPQKFELQKRIQECEEEIERIKLKPLKKDIEIYINQPQIKAEIKFTQLSNSLIT